MKKRYGITNDPERRHDELKKEFSGLKNFQIEGKFSSQKLAQEWENRKKNQHPGGPKTEGPIYGYSHNYNRRKPKG